MKTKRLLFLGASIMAISVLTGCGKGPQEKFIISISQRSSAAEMDMLKIWKEGYEALHPEVEVKIDGWGSINSSEAYVQKYALNRSLLTDIIYTSDDTTALLATKNNFVDLRQYYENDPDIDYTDFYATMLHTTSFNGLFKPTTSYSGSYYNEELPEDEQKSDNKEYGVFFAPREYNMPGLVLNVDLFNEYGIPVPTKETWNWNTFVDLLNQINDMTKQKYEVEHLNKYSAYRAIELNEAWEPVYTSIFKELGGDGLFTFDDGEALSNVDSAANVEVYKKLINVFGNGTHKYSLQRDHSAIQFTSGTTFMAAVSYPEVGNFYQVIKNIAFLPFPSEYVSAGCGGYGILVNKDKKDVQKIVTGETRKTADICWDFIKYIITEEGQNKAGLKGYIQPVLKKLATTGDWLQSYDPNLDHTAFCTGKELALDTYTFATPGNRASLRQDISLFINKLLAVESREEELPSLLSQTNKSVNEHLKNRS